MRRLVVCRALPSECLSRLPAQPVLPQTTLLRHSDMHLWQLPCKHISPTHMHPPPRSPRAGLADSVLPLLLFAAPGNVSCVGSSDYPQPLLVPRLLVPGEHRMQAHLCLHGHFLLPFPLPPPYSPDTSAICAPVAPVCLPAPSCRPSQGDNTGMGSRLHCEPLTYQHALVSRAWPRWPLMQGFTAAPIDYRLHQRPSSQCSSDPHLLCRHGAMTCRPLIASADLQSLPGHQTPHWCHDLQAPCCLSTGLTCSRCLATKPLIGAMTCRPLVASQQG